MTSDVVNRCLVAMFDLEHDTLARQHLPEPHQRRVLEAVRSLKRMYPFPSLSVRFGPTRRVLSIRECQHVFTEAYDEMDRKVQPMLVSDDKSTQAKGMELAILRGQLSALAIAASSIP